MVTVSKHLRLAAGQRQVMRSEVAYRYTHNACTGCFAIQFRPDQSEGNSNMMTGHTGSSTSAGALLGGGVSSRLYSRSTVHQDSPLEAVLEWSLDLRMLARLADEPGKICTM